jgi:hypothetical protein
MRASWTFYWIALAACTGTGAVAGPRTTGIPAGLLPGTVVGAASSGAAGAQTPFCVLNPGPATTGPMVRSAGPSAGVFRADQFGVLVSVPRLEAGFVQSGSNELAVQYYASGVAQLQFTDSQDGSLAFAPGSVPLGAGIVVGFSGYNLNFNPATGVVSVYFVVSLPGCSVPFEATYQS